MKCYYCGKTFEVGNRPDGLPNGMGFQSPDGSVTDVCSDCIIEAGNNINNLKKKSSADLVQVYTILVSQENPTEKILTKQFINSVKKNKGGGVEFGYDYNKYIAAFVFKTRLNRDRCASANELDRQIDSINGALFALREARDKGMFESYSTQEK